MFDGSWMAQARVGTLELEGDFGMFASKSLDMHLVDNRFMPGGFGMAIVTPVKLFIHHDALGDKALIIESGLF